MSSPILKTVGRTALRLSVLVFGVFFLNVLIGGPLGRKPWMSDVWEMLTLFIAVVFFVVGTICGEAETNRSKAEKEASAEG
jgi:hypothetical protein